jgi:hypothetical protein
MAPLDRPYLQPITSSGLKLDQYEPVHMRPVFLRIRCIRKMNMGTKGMTGFLDFVHLPEFPNN